MLPSPLIFVSHLRHLVFFYSQTFVLHAELQVFSFLLNFFLHLKLQKFFSPLTFVLLLNVLDLDSQGELKLVSLHFIVVKQFLRENQTVDLLLMGQSMPCRLHRKWPPRIDFGCSSLFLLT